MPISLLNVVRHRTSSTVIGRLPLPNIRVTLLYDTYGVGGGGGEGGEFNKKGSH